MPNKATVRENKALKKIRAKSSGRLLENKSVYKRTGTSHWSVKPKKFQGTGDLLRTKCPPYRSN